MVTPGAGNVERDSVERRVLEVVEGVVAVSSTSNAACTPLCSQRACETGVRRSAGA